LSNLRWTLALVGGLLIAAATEGPDFGSYTDWAAAALSGDIFTLRGNVLSPTGVPFTLAAAGPGLIFALGKAAFFPLTLVAAAIATGWVAAIVFWACALAVLRRVADGQDGLVLFGAGGLFAGTHAGLYSHAYATEVFANALIAAVWAIALTRERWRIVDSAAVGALAGLLLLVRAHVVLYAVPALWMAVFGDTARSARPWRAIAAGIPLTIAVLEYALVNRWMTGSWTHPPYLYGGAGFSSVDLVHPQFAAVLLHPLHGLLSYHPLYGVAVVALITQAWRGGRLRPLWAATLVAVILHVWVQAGWYIWWLGGTTFGMRGMAPAALPLIAGLIAAIRHDAAKHPPRAALWVGAGALACVWSIPLLVSGNSQFYSWSALLSAQTPALIAVSGVAIVFGFLLIRSRPLDEAALDRLAKQLSIALGVALVVYLGYRVTQMPDVLARGIAGVIAAAVIAGGMSVWRSERAPLAIVMAVLAVFTAQAALFARMAIRTERHLASGAEPPRPFAYVSASPVDELRVTYAEYLEVPGFEPQKAAFRRFLQWQRLDASRLSPGDQRTAEAILQLIRRDPAFGRDLIELVVRNGVAHVSSRAMTGTQQSRIRALALSVPGVTSVTFVP
jgi:hypothetical protein